MVVVVYTSHSAGNQAIKKKQAAILDFLKFNKIEYEEIDLCEHTDAKDIMRSKVPDDIKEQYKANNKPILAPQVFNNDEYCGDYDMFFNAQELELLHTFFKVPPPPKEEKKLAEYRSQNIPIQFN